MGPDLPLETNRGPDRWAWGPDGYTERNRAGRRLSRVEPSRRTATRSDPLTVTGLGLLHPALGFIRLKRRKTAHRP